MTTEKRTLDRRTLVAQGAAALVGGAALFRGVAEAQHGTQHPPGHGAQHKPTPQPKPAPARVSAARRGIIVPNGRTLPWKTVRGVKVFHLVAEVIEHEFAPGLKAECWGYNGSTPGPVIEATEGDRVRIYVTNRLPEPTTVHWHGMFVPNGMDGVSGLSQPPIQPGETFKYEFTLRQHGTFMYHPHFDEMVQMAMGMMGMFIIHPRAPEEQDVDRDFAIMLSEWAIKPGTRRPDPLEMKDFNVLTMNSKAFPGTEPLLIQRGERVRIRFGNLSAMDHHPIHMHDHRFHVTATDGGVVPESARWPETSVLVPVGATRNIEFVAEYPGDWAMHCHMTHHVMNQMGHGIPNMLGVKTDTLDTQVRTLLPGYMTMGQHGMGEMADMGMKVPANAIPMMGGEGPFSTIDMGGMFTILKIRDRLDASTANGWYTNPKGTVAALASEEDLKADGVDVG